MATVTFAAGAFTKSWTISAADVTRIMNAYQAKFRPQGGPDLTQQQVFDKITQQIEHYVLKNPVREVEGRAAAAVPDITMT